MRVYVTKSRQLTLYIYIDGVKKVVVFDRGIREEGLMAHMVTDDNEAKALESINEFKKEFWFYEERPDVQTKVESKSTRKIYYKPGTEPKGETIISDLSNETDNSESEEPESTTSTDHPEVTNVQKAKLLLLSLVPGSVHADFNTSEKARAKAKDLNITFSNWPQT